MDGMADLFLGNNMPAKADMHGFLLSRVVDADGNPIELERKLNTILSVMRLLVPASHRMRLEAIAQVLEDAERQGTTDPQSEGEQWVSLSTALAEQLVDELRAVARYARPGPHVLRGIIAQLEACNYTCEAGSNDSCPDGLVCIDGLCLDATLDAQIGDVSLPDGDALIPRRAASGGLRCARL